ncbi:MAG: PQQ-dependent dehydrogenase, methanol/ethanol family [Proteobacteria bacterium]|nr:PQQ-dependent dehydrogenase, methanol/ethanol family [Pseudomonadota bacterium]
MPTPTSPFICGILCVLAASVQPVAAQGTDGQWTTPSGTLQGTRYSNLQDINPANAHSLVEEFAFPTGARASHQGQPLVVGSMMYIVTPFPDKLIAIDLHNPGVALWTFDPHARVYSRGVACCDVDNRGAVYTDGKIIYNTLDDTTVAVDATTGTLVWRTRLGSPRTGETITGAPIVVNGKVIVGDAGGELGVRGWVQALDAKTGHPLWKAYNTGPDSDVLIGPAFHAYYAKDRGQNLGSTTWPGTMWQQGGSTTWGWLTYDPDLNLVYYGTSNPGVWNPDMRPGDNKWSASIVARNADTGQAAWAYQLTPHDGWDYDAMNESIVTNLTVNGQMRKVVVHFDKNGFAYTLDRATGQALVAQKFGNVTWADHIDLTTGAPAVLSQPHEGVIAKNICPSPLGAKEFVPAAFSPKTQLFYVPAINACDDLEPLKARYIAGSPFMGANIQLMPGPGGNFGELIAWDAAKGTRVWSVTEPLPIYGGVLATAGGVIFYGTLDKWFKAVDAGTGQLLFQKQLECGIVGNPISYTAPDGKQRVAIYSGVGWLAGGFAGGPCPGGGTHDSESRTTNAAPLAAAIDNLPTSGAAVTSTVTSGRVHVFKLP